MKIAVIGSYGAAITMGMPRLPHVGETLVGTDYDLGPGGKGSNQAVAATRLGAEVSILTAVGEDIFGSEAMELWKQEGVDASQVIVLDTPTMVATIWVQENGENRIVIVRGALAEFKPEHVERFRQTIAEADLALVSMEIPLETAMAALKIARDVGTKTVLNPAPAAELPNEAWDWIDVLTPNQTEGHILLGLSPEENLSHTEVIAKIRARTSAQIVLTLGSQGCMISEGETLTAIPAIAPSKIVDTTGAGDSFSAALAVGLCEGKSLVEAAKMATAAGSHAVTILGVIDALPSRAQINALLEKN